MPDYNGLEAVEAASSTAHPPVFVATSIALRASGKARLDMSMNATSEHAAIQAAAKAHALTTVARCAHSIRPSGVQFG